MNIVKMLHEIVVRWEKCWRWTAIGLLVAGSALLLVCRSHNAAHAWYTLNIPLEAQTGFETTGSFVADLDQPHEIELQFDQRASHDANVPNLLSLAESPMDVSWTVNTGSNTVARGDARDYLYFGYKSLKRRLWNAIVNAPDDFGVVRGKIIRGIGSFDARAGEPYEITVTVREARPELQAAQPTVAVRINRQFADRHYAEKIAAGAMGIGVLLLAGMSGGFWLLSRLSGGRNTA